MIGHFSSSAAAGSLGSLLASIAVDALGGAAAVLALGLGGVVAWGRRSVTAAAGRQRHAEQRAAASESARSEAESREGDLAAQLERAAADRRRLSAEYDRLTADARGLEAEAERLAAAARSADRHDRALEALWGLTQLEYRWAARDEAALSTAPAAATGGVERDVEREIIRIREEAGTPGQLIAALRSEPAPGDALLLLRGLRSLLATVVRRCDHYTVELRQDGGVLHVAVTCEAFDGAPAALEDARQVLAVLSTVGVDGAVVAGPDHLGVRLAFPAMPRG